MNGLRSVRALLLLASLLRAPRTMGYRRGSNGFLETASTSDWSRGDVVEGGGASPNEFVRSSDSQTMYAATNDSSVQVWTVDGLVKAERVVLDESKYGGGNDVVCSPTELLLEATDGEGIIGYVDE